VGQVQDPAEPTDVRTSDPRLLVLIGGLPGAGKTTLLRRLLAERPPGVVGLDAEQVTDAWRAAGVRLPYRLLRPWVHLVHRRRVVRAVRGPTPVVVVTDPLTSGRRRAALVAAAAAEGRQVRVLLVRAAGAEALAGQSARGRAVPPRAMRRHLRRWAATLAESRSPAGLAGVQRTVVVDRAAAAHLRPLDVLGRIGLEASGRA
jgi:ABC-type cobalamin/Fe3+-siderophores transport system ATPase subunit